MSLIIKKNTTFKIPRTPPFLPSSLGGLSLWLKADTGVTLGISQIIISGFTGVYAGANGTYNYDYAENWWYHSGANYYINSGGELIEDSIYGGVIATNSNNFQGAWSPGNYFSTITISNAGIPSVNGVYTRSNEINFDSSFTASGGRSINYQDNNGFWFTNPSAAYQNNDEYLSVGGWFAVDDGGNITAVNSTSPRNVGSPTSTVVTDIVTAWADQSGNGNNATATGTPSTSTVDGKAFVDFSGGYFTGNELITSPYVTIMCVARYSDAQDIAMMFEQFSDADNLAFYRGYSGNDNFRIYNGVDLDSSSSTNVDETYLFGTTVNNDTGTLFLNGSQDANDLCGEITPAGTYYLGRFEGGGSTTIFLKMAEIIVYDRVLTTPERQQVETYLNSKYQIY